MRLMRPINFAVDDVVVAGATLRVANGLEITDGRIDPRSSAGTARRALSG